MNINIMFANCMFAGLYKKWESKRGRTVEPCETPYCLFLTLRVFCRQFCLQISWFHILGTIFYHLERRSTLSEGCTLLNIMASLCSNEVIKVWKHINVQHWVQSTLDIMYLFLLKKKKTFESFSQSWPWPYLHISCLSVSVCTDVISGKSLSECP